jgi:hypothetical protein
MRLLNIESSPRGSLGQGSVKRLSNEGSVTCKNPQIWRTLPCVYGQMSKRFEPSCLKGSTQEK